MTSLAKTYLNITRKNINDLNLNKNHKMDPSNPVWITQQKHFIVLYVHVHTNKFIWTVLHPVLIYAPWLYPICIEHHNICDCLGHPSPNIQKWSSSYLAKNVIFFPIWKGGGGVPWIYHCRIVLHHCYCTMPNFWDICDLQYFNWYC